MHNLNNMMDEDSFKRLICKDQTCNFVAVILSPWHANGVDATISFLKDRGVELKGYVAIGAHPTKGRFIDKTNFATNDDNIKILNVDITEKSWINKIYTNIFALIKLLFDKNRKTDRVLYMCNTCYPDFSWIERLKEAKNLRINYVIIDEGIGAYYSQDRTDWVNTHLEEKGISHSNIFFRAVYSVLFLMRQMPNRIMIHKLKEKKRLIDNQLLTIKNGRLVENKNITKSYRKIFQQNNSILSAKSIPAYANAIVLNTSRLEERDTAVLKYSVNIENKIISYANDRDMKIVIKPHPRETTFKDYYELGCFVDAENKISQEAIVAKLKEKPALFIALNSSTLINIKTIFQIPTVSYAKIILKTDVSELEKNMLRKFIEKFEGIVKFPETYDELADEIEKVMCPK